MSEAATPLLRSTAATDRAAALAWRSAVATEPALVCTPIDRDSWFGTPDTLPVPVTVMRAVPVAAVRVLLPAVVLPAASLAEAGAALPWPAPRANAAMSRPAEATPAAAARWTGENWTAMVPLRRGVGMGHRLDAAVLALVPAARRIASAGRQLRRDLPDARHALHPRAIKLWVR